MKLGQNIGEILLNIAQNAIQNGKTDVAEVYGDFNPFSEVTWENSPKELIIKTEEK